MTTVYRKTPQGVAEIETRALRLAPRLRSVLILVDGRRTDDELRAMLGATADEALGRLLADGFVDIVSRTVGPAPVAVAAPAAAPPAPARVDVATLRRTAVRDLTDLVGPMGEAAALRIERAKTLDELRAALTLAAQIVANSRGRPAAEAFAARHGLI